MRDLRGLSCQRPWPGGVYYAGTVKEVLAERPLPGAPLEQRAAYDPWEGIAVTWDARKVRCLSPASHNTFAFLLAHRHPWLANPGSKKGQMCALLLGCVQGSARVATNPAKRCSPGVCRAGRSLTWSA